jgi:prevent-host-death family protein
MRQYDISEAKPKLSALVNEVLAGGEVVLAKRGKPVAKIVRIEPDKKQPRKLGIFKGQIWMSDDFNAPLEEFKEYM